jgi:hypothetical protein
LTLGGFFGDLKSNVMPVFFSIITLSYLLSKCHSALTPLLVAGRHQPIVLYEIAAFEAEASAKLRALHRDFTAALA